MPYIETPTLKIHYRMAGSGSTPIVFLHGNYASSRWWDPLLASIPGAYRALAPDLRGCGSREDYSTRSGMVTRDLSIQTMVQDLVDFLAGLVIERTVLLGHSLGGLIATSFAIQFPDNVQALVLEDTGPAQGISLGSVTTPLLLPLEIKNRQMLQRALRRVGVPRSGSLAKTLVEDALSAPRGLYFAFARAAAWNEGDALDCITAPTLLIWGEQDRVMPSRYAKDYLQQIPDARLVIIPDAGHSPHLEQQEKFVEELYTFLDDQTQKRKNPNALDP